MADIPNTPETREEQYLAALAGAGSDIPAEPITRTEQYLAAIYANGGTGGGGGTGGTTNYNALSNRPRINGVLLSGDKSTSDLGISTYDDTALAGRVTAVESGKVDKVSGKGLSANDYTNAEKTKLAGLENYDDTALAARVTALESKTTTESTKVDSLETALDDLKDEIPEQQNDSNFDDFLDDLFG